MAVIKTLSDSVIQRQQAIAFIRKLKGCVITSPQFRLENQPASLKQNYCLQAVLADKKTFTPSELKAIETAATQKAARWSATEFAPGKLLDTDSINEIFKDRRKGWTYFNQRIGENFNAFSFPLFIRGNTYCLFYTAMYCGWLCAEGNLILYRKSATGWVEVKRYCSWVS